MKPIIRVITVGNGVFARLGGGGPNGILPGICGALDYNKANAINTLINKLKEKYPGQYPENPKDFEIINVNQDGNNRPFKPVNTTKSQAETSKAAPLVSETPVKNSQEPELGTTQQIEQYIQGMTEKSDS